MVNMREIQHTHKKKKKEEEIGVICAGMKKNMSICRIYNVRYITHKSSGISSVYHRLILPIWNVDNGAGAGMGDVGEPDINVMTWNFELKSDANDKFMIMGFDNVTHICDNAWRRIMPTRGRLSISRKIWLFSTEISYSIHHCMKKCRIHHHSASLDAAHFAFSIWFGAPSTTIAAFTFSNCTLYLALIEMRRIKCNITKHY